MSQQAEATQFRREANPRYDRFESKLNSDDGALFVAAGRLVSFSEVVQRACLRHEFTPAVARLLAAELIAAADAAEQQEQAT